MNRDEILAMMRTLVADCLAAPAEKVKPDSALIDELGADSLDFVDILFQIDKKFGVKIKTTELNVLAGLDLSTPMSQKGPLPPEAVEKLKEWLPALKKVSDPSRVTAAQFFKMISVETLCLLVEKKLAEASRPTAPAT